MLLISITPELEHFSQTKLADYFMGCDQSIHVCSKSKLSINRLLIKLDFNKAIWIGTNDEIDLSPINHDDFLNIIYYIRKLLSVDFVHASIVMGWLEITM